MIGVRPKRCLNNNHHDITTRIRKEYYGKKKKKKMCYLHINYNIIKPTKSRLKLYLGFKASERRLKRCLKNELSHENENGLRSCELQIFF